MKHIVLLICFLTSICVSAQTTFKPKSATIKDGQGTYTSEHFDCGNIVVYDNDNKSTIKVSVAGDTYTLKKSTANIDTYTFSQRSGDRQAEMIAYRSSRSNRIYLVILRTTWLRENRSVSISFKP